ncbi:VOC family protein [Paraburkholderia sp. MMS20-SJTN17]|uniref:VOC family protein n=1 Tax=Paraburkholderia translucens TaxID=2886945 RepID=A0ABS8KIP3_9BURK|nr:VOC family protein [Paraburkholderia sp. MMS20-SJTN17]MCC8404641.1 VOC family protein [Paraburkholderia sp. MMS20-SJTN17]
MSSKSATTESTGIIAHDMSLELIVIPVSDVDRAKRFYKNLGWRLDLDFFEDANDYRVIQFTPPGSSCSVIFGTNVTTAKPGTARDLYLVVSDIEAVRNQLIQLGVPVSEPFHDTSGVFHHADGRFISTGFNPQRKSYASYASFSDPDGNNWILQEITARLSGDVKNGDPRFTEGIVNAIRNSNHL